MNRHPPVSTRTDTLFPYTTLFRSHQADPQDHVRIVLRTLNAPAADHGVRTSCVIAGWGAGLVATLHDGGCFPNNRSGGRTWLLQSRLNSALVAAIRGAAGRPCFKRRVNRSEERRVGKECVNTF